MGLVEQAVELLKQAGAREPAEPEKALGRSIGQLVDSSADLPALRRRAAAAAMPCRDDRIVRIDSTALREAGLMAPQVDERQLAEEYRIIKRPLLAAIKGDSSLLKSNVIVVASALPDEGKSFTCINLALSLALERDCEVLLVDGDVAKPHITHLFGLDEELGLLDVVGAANRKLDEAIVPTDFASLYVLPAGSQDPEATEILRSERMSSVLANLVAEPRRILLIDSPPLLVTSEAGVLTSLAGQVVLVVKASSTPQEAVLRAVDTIAEGTRVSLVLNQADAVREHRYAYYGRYGYGRAYGRGVDGVPESGLGQPQAEHDSNSRQEP